MRRLLVLLLETFASLVGLAFLLCGLLIWRLLSGPVTTQAFSPMIAEQLSLPQYGITTHVRQSVISWDRSERAIVIGIKNLTTQNRAGQTVADLPSLDIDIRLIQLLRLHTGAIKISAQEPFLALRRWQDGRLTLDGLLPAARHVAADASPDQPQNGSEIAQQIADLTNQVWWLGRLTEFEIADANLVVHDWEQNAPWQFKLKTLILSKEDHELRGNADLLATVSGHPMELTTGLEYQTREAKGSLDWEMHDFALGLLADWFKSQGLPAQDMTLDMKFHIDFDAHNPDSAVHVAVAGGKGRLDLRPFMPDAFAVNALALDVTALIDEKAFPQKLSLDRLTLDLGGGKSFTVQADAQADSAGKNVAFTLGAKVYGFGVSDLPKFWPQSASPDSRVWVLKNIKAGSVPATTLTLTGHAPVDNLAAGKLDTLAGEMTIVNATINYLDGLPPAQDVSAIAKASLGAIDFAISAGRIDAVAVTPSSLHIGGLDKKDQTLSMSMGLAGPLEEVLRIIDLPPLGYPSAVGLRPKDATGDVNATLDISFPLLKKLALADVDLHGKGTLSNGANNTLVTGLAVTKAKTDVRFDKQSLRFDGQALLNDIPAALSWTEHFSGSLLSEAKIGMRIDQAGARNFGLTLDDYWQGLAAVDLSYRRFADHHGEVDARADLTTATLDLHRLNWRKPQGVQAALALKARLVPAQDIAVSDIVFAAPSATFKGSATLDHGDLSLKAIYADSFKAGATDAHFNLARRPDRGWQGALGGNALDLSGQPLAQTDKAQPPVPLDLRLDLGRVIFGQDRLLAPLRGTIQRDAAGWQQIDLKAAAQPGGSAFSAELKTISSSSTNAATGGAAGEEATAKTTSAGRFLRIETADIGAFLHAVNWSDSINGGALSISGSSPSADPAMPIEGKIRIGSYKLYKAPFVLSLLNLLSVEGIGNLMQGDSDSFDHMKGDFALKGYQLSLSNVRTSGSAVGFTLDGSLDLAANECRFEGTIVPAYGFNHVIANIPIIGDFLNGGTGQGIFAATYKMTGPLDNPQTSINPASVLAPGFLRNLFFLGGNDEDDSGKTDMPGTAQ